MGAKDSTVFLGPRPGTGRTHLATGVAIRAGQAGDRVLFATATECVDLLGAFHHDGASRTNCHAWAGTH